MQTVNLSRKKEYTLSQSANILGYTYVYTWNLTKKAKLKKVDTAKGQVLILGSVLGKWLADHKPKINIIWE
jgi:hypothetical protein